jgi:hypothetical protein
VQPKKNIYVYLYIYTFDDMKAFISPEKAFISSNVNSDVSLAATWRMDHRSPGVGVGRSVRELLK